MVSFKNAQDALDYIEESKGGVIEIIRQNYKATTGCILDKIGMEELEYRLSLVRENLDDIFADQVAMYRAQQRKDDLAESISFVKEHSTYHPNGGRA